MRNTQCWCWGLSPLCRLDTPHALFPVKFVEEQRHSRRGSPPSNESCPLCPGVNYGLELRTLRRALAAECPVLEPAILTPLVLRVRLRVAFLAGLIFAATVPKALPSERAKTTRASASSLTVPLWRLAIFYLQLIEFARLFIDRLSDSARCLRRPPSFLCSFTWIARRNEAKLLAFVAPYGESLRVAKGIAWDGPSI
jgi:hypothetical protein